MNDSSEEPCGPLGPPVPDYIPGSVDVIRNEAGDNVEISKTPLFRQTNPSGFRSYSMWFIKRRNMYLWLPFVQIRRSFRKTIDRKK